MTNDRSPSLAGAATDPGTRPPLQNHFPGLDSLRFYAAISVVVAHTTNNFGEFRTRRADYALLNFLLMDAQSAVSLFFVLSGFLITYLLLKEQSLSGRIHVGNFYVRRTLRIWPLYYLTALIGFVLLPGVLPLERPLDWWSPSHLLLVGVFLPNMASPLGPLGHLWSIGLEEQFYLAWPWIVKRQARFVRIALGVVLVKLMITPVILVLNTEAVTNLLLGLRFECMAIGALGAYFYFHRHPALRAVYSPWARALSLAAIVLVALIDLPTTIPGTIVLSALFVLFILNLSTHPSGWIKADPRPLGALGKMSYGIYMYHYPVLYTTLFFLHSLRLPEDDRYKWILYGAVLGSTLALAALSYRWFESPFLSLKERFQVT
jgi:peptidoglycan/LPS O-acetylase OafA/YrhL